MSPKWERDGKGGHRAYVAVAKNRTVRLEAWPRRFAIAEGSRRRTYHWEWCVRAFGYHDRHDDRYFGAGVAPTLSAAKRFAEALARAFKEG
jgi:hypothetical protein